MTLTSSAGWYNGPNRLNRCFSIGNYQDSWGFNYGAYGYSQNFMPGDLAGAWPESGIVGNVVTLNTFASANLPLNPNDPNGTWPVGTPIRNTILFTSGTLLVEPQSPTQDTWLNHGTTFGGGFAVTTADWATGGKPPQGTAFIKVETWGNYAKPAVGDFTYDISAFAMV